MQIIVAGQTLADWSNPLASLGADGACQVQETDIIRSVQKALRYRGNETVQMVFATTIQFASLALAEAFVAGFWSELVKQGSATFNCGWGDADPDLVVVSTDNCVIKSFRAAIIIGCTVRATYTLLFGAAAVGALPGPIPPTPGLMTQLIDAALASGATTWSFTYPTPFTTNARASINLLCPGGGDITAYMTFQSLTQCSGTLSSPIPSSPSGYAISGQVSGA